MAKKQKKYSYLTPEQIKVVERGQIRRAEAKERMEFKKASEEEAAGKASYKTKKAVSKLSKVKERVFSSSEAGRIGKRKIKGRERKVKGALGALGVLPASRYSGPGRPRGTYKYGMPIQEYKKKLSMKKALYREYKDKQQLALQRRGLSPEQVQQLQAMRSAEEIYEGEVPEERFERVREMQMQRRMPSQRPRVERQQRVSRERGYPQHSFEVPDDELRFQEWSANNTVSPNTQRLLNNIRRIQNKGKSDNIAQQRRHWERRLVGANTNLMKAHENMIDVRMDMTGVNPEENILMAPNVFRETPENGNILKTERYNIMQTREAGNNLKFF